MATIVSNTFEMSGSGAIYKLLSMLCSSSWRIFAWSDGTIYHNTSADPVTSNSFGSAGSGTDNLGNTNAWFRVVCSGSTREWLFQRGASEVAWTVARSRVGFLQGTPNSSSLPTDTTSSITLVSNATTFDAAIGSWNISSETAHPFGWTAFAISGSTGSPFLNISLIVSKTT